MRLWDPRKATPSADQHEIDKTVHFHAQPAYANFTVKVSTLSAAIFHGFNEPPSGAYSQREGNL